VQFDRIPLSEASFVQHAMPSLRQLRLDGLAVQLGPAGGIPGLLQHCTGLTALSLQGCEVQDVAAAAAAIAALPQLQSLRLVGMEDEQGKWLSVLKSAAVLRQLMHLAYDFCAYRGLRTDEVAVLSQLSRLANLGHLVLTWLPDGGVPGGLPSQLVKLTCLDVQASQLDTAEQFQHLSSLTALQQLSVENLGQAVGGMSGLSGIQRLSQLTGLELVGPGLHVDTATVQNWPCSAGLQNLSLHYGRVQPEALARFTKLQDLDLSQDSYWMDQLDQHQVGPLDKDAFQGFLGAVSQLSLLTSLHGQFSFQQAGVLPPPAAAFTALTASTNLCLLKLSMESAPTPQGLVLFKQGTMYPNLRSVVMYLAHPLSEQQLQQLCACCPGVECLMLAACCNPSPTAWQPLTQLSALTRLVVHEVGEAAAALADAAAKLTGLRQVQFWGVRQGTSSRALLPLTTLKALERLTFNTSGYGSIALQNKASGSGSKTDSLTGPWLSPMAAKYTPACLSCTASQHAPLLQIEARPVAANAIVTL
jgi:hypothetical protein